MRTLIGLAKQLTFGWDTISGLTVFALLSLVFQEPANVWFLLWCGFWAYAPDLDLTYFLLQGKETRKWGHWRLGFHHPIFVLPLFGGIAYGAASAIFPDDVGMLTLMAVTCVFLHFVHDSTIMGLHWLSPFTVDGRVSFADSRRWAHYKISSSGIRRWSQEEVDAEYARIASESLAGKQGDEIGSRIEEVTSQQYFFWVLCMSLITLLVLWQGVALPV